MSGSFRISTDGFFHLTSRPVRTPGCSDRVVTPTPEKEALTFLLSHSFPGHRRIVRGLSVGDRKKIRMALWANSVGERMALVDRVWRSISQPASPPPNPDEPHLIQVVRWEVWAYPVYLDGEVTRVIPVGGLPVPELDAPEEIVVDLEAA